VGYLIVNEVKSLAKVCEIKRGEKKNPGVNSGKRGVNRGGAVVWGESREKKKAYKRRGLAGKIELAPGDKNIQNALQRKTRKKNGNSQLIKRGRQGKTC